MFSTFPAVASDEDPPTLCLAITEATDHDLSVAALREEYKAAFRVGTDDCVFPKRENEVADAWSEFQDLLYEALRDAGLDGLAGHSLTSVVLFAPDGRIDYYFHNGLRTEEHEVFCGVIKGLALAYRFPLEANVPFSQCGTTHFKEKDQPR